MPRIRTIKPEIWNSEDFIGLSLVGQLAFIALITLADDEGRVKTSPLHLATTCVRRAKPAQIQQQLDVMSELGMVVQYEVDGRAYIALTNWPDHQKVDHPSPSRLPSPDDSGSVRENSRGLAASRGPADRTGPDRTKDQTGTDLSPPRVPPGPGGNHQGKGKARLRRGRAETLAAMYDQAADEMDRREVLGQ